MKILFFILSLTLFFAGCGSSNGKSVDNIKELSASSVEVNSTVTLKLNESKNTKSYTWKNQYGTILGHASSISWTAPSKPGRYTITVDTVDDQNNKTTQSIVIDVTGERKSTSSTKDITEEKEEVEDKYIDPRSFTKIKNIIKSGKQATFIIAGDSTRAISTKHNSQIIFKNIQRELSRYGVKTILRAVGNYRLDQFIDNFEENENEPSATKVISDIKGEGENTIVEISLGINDLFALNEYATGTFDDNRASYKATIKRRLETAIELIQNAKPKTTIFLTTPNPLRDWEVATKMIQEVYKEVSEEKELPLVNFVDALMEGGTKTEAEEGKSGEYGAWYRDGVHFSDYGLSRVSTYILGEILP